jgi:hypothetical protein
MKYRLLLLSLFLAVSVSANVMQPLEYHYQLLIPVAGSAQGANGTFFRSDINIINLRTMPQKVRLRWLPQGRSGADVAPIEFTIGASTGIFSEDFVGSNLNQTGLGAIQILAIREDGVADTAGRLYATSRIWTPVPGSATGTMSQTFPVLPPTPGVAQKWIFGLRRDTRYRLNVGIVNMSGVKQSYAVRTSGSTSAGGEATTVDVEPLSVSQVNVAGTDTGSFQVVIESLGGSPLWEGWASSIDNVTGDAWSEVASALPSTPQP